MFTEAKHEQTRWSPVLIYIMHIMQTFPSDHTPDEDLTLQFIGTFKGEVRRNVKCFSLVIVKAWGVSFFRITVNKSYKINTENMDVTKNDGYLKMAMSL